MLLTMSFAEWSRLLHSEGRPRCGWTSCRACDVIQHQYLSGDHMQIMHLRRRITGVAAAGAGRQKADRQAGGVQGPLAALVADERRQARHQLPADQLPCHPRLQVWESGGEPQRTPPEIDHTCRSDQYLSLLNGVCQCSRGKFHILYEHRAICKCCAPAV